MSTFARYSRQVLLREVGVNGQALLRDSSVLIVGAGGLGSAAALYLAGAGVGRLVLADRDRVELSNLQRQILFRHADVGRGKTAAAATALAAFNPEVQVEVRDGDSWRDAVHHCDVVLDCTDNFPTRFAINAACVSARNPLVSGAAIRLEGQLAVFDRARGTACYACLYPDAGEAQETCEEAGILGPVAGTIGAMQALCALKLLLGIGDDRGRLHLWDARTLAWRTSTMTRDPDCSCCRSAT
ncbi:MAG TPA: molybdopterin-synthase adenylyltransferase MoeB [Nevskiaceae bacterium]|nr:molybdopterin-synthase adenylyltransferase MoeB [Nevskiaceae bacterium]